jgi:hypothetical protein
MFDDISLFLFFFFFFFSALGFSLLKDRVASRWRTADFATGVCRLSGKKKGPTTQVASLSWVGFVKVSRLMGEFYLKEIPPFFFST